MDILIFLEETKRHSIDFEEWKQRKFVEGWDLESQLNKIEIMNSDIDRIRKSTDEMKEWIDKTYIWKNKEINLVDYINLLK